MGRLQIDIICAEWKSTQNPSGRLRKTTDILIPCNQWDKSKGKVNGGYLHAEEVRIERESLLNQLRTQYSASNRGISFSEAKALLSNNSKNQGSSCIPLVEFDSTFNWNDDDSLVGRFMRQYRTQNGACILDKQHSKKNYEGMYRHLRTCVQNEFPNGLDIGRLEECAVSLFKAWRRLLIDQIGLATNTVHGLSKRLKQVLNWAIDEGLIDSVDLSPLNIKPIYEPNFALTAEDISVLENYDLSSNKSLDQVRDLFLLLCYTGQRYSDLKSLKSGSVNGDVLNVTTKKTGQPVSIPLRKSTTAILDKYPESLPEYSNQALNRSLKVLFAEAGLDRLITVFVDKHGHQSKVNKKLSEVITTHAGRRTFVSRSREQGIADSTIMRVTGHKSLSQLDTYTSIPDSSVAAAYLGLEEGS